jgi:hypothetical protein
MARSIVLDGKTYRYTIGGSFVRITNPDGKSRAFDYPEVTGLNWEAVERGQWKRTLSITPSDIEKFIREHILNGGAK